MKYINHVYKNEQISVRHFTVDLTETEAKQIIAALTKQDPHTTLLSGFWELVNK